MEDLAKDESNRFRKGHRRGPQLIRERFQTKLFLIPSFVTVGGIFCGFLAILTSVKGEASHFIYAAQCIGWAFILDGVDGRVARSLNATSAFGREFDSLSDVISFGVAPAVLVYNWGLRNTADEFGILVGFVYLVCGAARLARFNVTTTDEPKSSFTGLPIPGAAVAIAALVYSAPNYKPGEFMTGIISLYVLALGFLMISTLPFFSLKKVKLSTENVRQTLIGLSVLVALTWAYSRAMFLVIATAYVLSGPVKYILKRLGVTAA